MITADQKFFDAIREKPFGGSLTSAQVAGCNNIIGAWNVHFPNADKRFVANSLAQTFHETNQKMEPVREAYWLNEDWRKRRLRYYPFYGRGYVQLTWDYNYEHATSCLHSLGLLSAEQSLMKNPDLALDAGVAVCILIYGMSEGWFTRRKLSDYFNDKINDPIEARRIVSTDDASLIAGYHVDFLEAMS